MIIVEVLLMIAFASTGIICSISDFKTGLISNRILRVSLSIGVVLSGVYYGFFARDLFIWFACNVGIVTVFSLLLYFSKSFAGGDTKLAVVMSVLLPARFYFTYNGSHLTLAFSLLIAILFGYICLAVFGAVSAVSKRSLFEKGFIKGYIKRFFIMYLTMLPYITLIGFAVKLISDNWIVINPVVVYAICFIFAVLAGKAPILKKPCCIIPAVAVMIGFSIFMRSLPISLDWKSYLLVFITVTVQMLVSRIVYQTVSTEIVSKGMILSTVSSVMMQASKIKGLPGLSSEDLGDRLTEDEAEKVKEWGRCFGHNVEVTVVRKIPFAIFIACGFAAYFIIWLVLI